MSTRSRSRKSTNPTNASTLSATPPVSATKSHHNLRTRFATVGVIVVFGLIILQIWPPLLAMLIGSVAITEYNDMTWSAHNTQSLSPMRERLLHVLICNTMCASALYGHQMLTFTLMCTMALLITRELVQTIDTTPASFNRLCVQLVGHVYISYAWAHTVLLLLTIHSSIKYLSVTSPFTSTSHQITTIVFVILCTANGENGALFFGSLFGKHSARLLPHVSPNKSAVGFVAQVISSMLTAVLYTYCTRIKPPTYTVYDGMMLGVLLGVCGAVGDLFESYIKRCHQLKDSNSLVRLPGVGGVMDRIDGLIVNFVVTYYYYTYRGFVA